MDVVSQKGTDPKTGAVIERKADDNEPFAALDTASVVVLTTQLNQHMAKGGMAIITTHQDVDIQAQSTQTLRLIA